MTVASLDIARIAQLSGSLSLAMDEAMKATGASPYDLIAALNACTCIVADTVASAVRASEPQLEAVSLMLIDKAKVLGSEYASIQRKSFDAAREAQRSMAKK